MEHTLKKLHYHPKWQEYGFLEPAFLEHQLKQYESGVDECLEHYRFDAFCQVLERMPALDNSMIDRYVELAVLDEDGAMAQAALALLIKNPQLTTVQLNRLRAHKAFTTEVLQKIIEQRYLLRALDNVHLSNDLFERCLLSKNNDVQRKLLSTQELSLDQLTTLMDRGVNSAVRNLARARLRRHIK